MPEADHDLLARDALLDVGRGAVSIRVAILDAESELVCAAMFRAAQRADTAGNGREHIRTGCRDDAVGKRGGVELMLRIQSQGYVHGANPGWRWGRPVQEAQEVLGNRL